jgi:pantoate--beta-alanine ligase
MAAKAKTSASRKAAKKGKKKAPRAKGKSGRKQPSRPAKKKSQKAGKAAEQKMPAKPLKIIRTVKDMRKYVKEMRSRRRRIALVPTMGYLHDGHITLVKEARRLSSVVVVSVFVNPTQFGPNEDLDRYPRDPSGDRRKLRQAGADVMFLPDTSEIYPDGFQTYLDVTEVTSDYCGASRPGHFRGVATVVFKLFSIVEPDVAVFGEKDYQQLVCIRQMVRDLNLDVQVVGMPTIREEDGLAMSSRNAYLSPAQRQQATAIFRGLRKARRLLDSGERDAAELAAIVMDLLREESGLSIDYVTVCDPNNLERIPEVEKNAVLLVGVKVGDTRLIDNIRLEVKRSRSRR